MQGEFSKIGWIRIHYYLKWGFLANSLLEHPEICAAMQKFGDTPKFNAVQVKLGYIKANPAWDKCKNYMTERKAAFKKREDIIKANVLRWTYV